MPSLGIPLGLRLRLPWVHCILKLLWDVDLGAHSVGLLRDIDVALHHLGCGGD